MFMEASPVFSKEVGSITICWGGVKKKKERGEIMRGGGRKRERENIN